MRSRSVRDVRGRRRRATGVSASGRGHRSKWAARRGHISGSRSRGHAPEGAYELLITRHWLSLVTGDQRPQLGTEILFRGVHGRAELDLSGKDRAQAGNVVPTFYSLAGEAIAMPEKFLALVRATTKGVNCIGCT